MQYFQQCSCSTNSSISSGICNTWIQIVAIIKVLVLVVQVIAVLTKVVEVVVVIVVLLVALIIVVALALTEVLLGVVVTALLYININTCSRSNSRCTSTHSQ